MFKFFQRRKGRSTRETTYCIRAEHVKVNLDVYRLRCKVFAINYISVLITSGKYVG